MARQVVWFEIPVQDPERAQQFYGLLFGWGFGEVQATPPRDMGSRSPGDMGSRSDSDTGRYWIIHSAEQALGGGMVEVQSPPGAGVVVYVEVDDLAKVLREASAMGGEVVTEPTLINPQAGSLARLKDTEGNVMGLWSPEVVES